MDRIKNNVFKMLALFFMTTVCGVVGAVTYVSSARASASETVQHVCADGEYCLVCDVAEQVDALPTADEITLDNAAAVTQQIHNIDRIKYDMSDEQFDQFRTLVEVENYGDVVRYDNAVAKLQSLQGYTQLAIAKKLDLCGEAVQDTSEAEVSFSVRNISTNQTTELTLFDLGCETSALGENAYQMTSDGWIFSYTLPVGTYEITELNTDKPIAINGREVYFECQSMSFNGETATDNGIIVTLQENDYNVVTVLNGYPTYTFKAQDTDGNPIAGVGFSYNDWSNTTGDDGTFTQSTPWIASGEITVSSIPAEYCASPSAVVTYTDNAGDVKGKDDTPIITMSLDEAYTFVFAKHRYSHGVCAGCDSEDASQGHTYGELVGEEPATCEENGVKAHYLCSCGAYFDEEKNVVTYDELITAATGHNYSPWIDTKEATTKEHGERKKVCVACGDIVVEQTPKAEPLVKDTDLTVVLIVIGVVLIMGAVAYVVTKNNWTE